MLLKNHNAWIGFLVLIAAIGVFISVVRQGLTGDSFTKLPPTSHRDEKSGEESNRNPQSIHKREREPGKSNPNRPKLELGRTQPELRHWTLDELEAYLAREAKSKSSDQMASLMFNGFPGPPGSEPRFNRLLPGSISLADQTRLCLKYLDPLNQTGLLSGLWSKYRDSPASNEFLGEVASELQPGYLRDFIVNHVVSQYYRDLDRFSELLLRDDPVGEIFPNFTSIPGDGGRILFGLGNASIRLLEDAAIDKEDMISLIENSNMKEGEKVSIIERVNKRFR